MTGVMDGKDPSLPQSTYRVNLDEYLKKRSNMTVKTPFECLLFSQDPAVFCTVEGVLRDFSIHTKVCLSPSKVANLLAEGFADLIVIDLEDEGSSDVMSQISQAGMQHSRTVLAVSAVDCAMPGVDLVLRKPVTLESTSQSIKSAYSRMVKNYRKHTRFAVMTPVLAAADDKRTLAMTVTNIGEGGVGMTTNEKLSVGSLLSFRMSLPGLARTISIQVRVVWSRPSGAIGCTFVDTPVEDLAILHAWLESKYRFIKPLIPG